MSRALILIATSDSDVNLSYDYEPGRSQEGHGNNTVECLPANNNVHNGPGGRIPEKGRACVPAPAPTPVPVPVPVPVHLTLIRVRARAAKAPSLVAILREKIMSHGIVSDSRRFSNSRQNT